MAKDIKVNIRQEFSPGVNEQLEPEQRVSKPVPENLDSGPKVGEKGEFKPASYATHRKNVRTDN
jgi:hypothetical protein